MGNQQSHQSSPSPQHPNSQSHSQSPQQSAGKPTVRRQASEHAQRSRPSLAHRASLHSSRANTASNPNSEAGSFDYTLTPSTSLSPSLTRLETQHYHSHRHGSSLDSYLPSHHGPGPAVAMGAASSSEKLPKPRAQNRDRTESGSPRTTPVSVPTRQKSLRQRGNTPQPETPEFRPSGPPRDNDVASYAPPQPVFHHPPRLPLPIEHEDLTPGSPVLDAKDFTDEVPEIEGEDELNGGRLVPNKSLLSQTTADGEEEESVGDLTELDTLGPEQKRRTVPVEVTWIEPGDKIYVTGTFANWSKKFRMHRDPETGHAKTTLDLLPGMHHIRYIVDGEMRLREDNDQAVDYTNTLVNIIEVPAEPVFPQQAQDDGEKTPGIDSVGRDLSLHPPQVLPPNDGVEAHDHAPRASTPEPLSEDAKKAVGPELMEIPHAHYGAQIPNYLIDLDRDEKTARFQRASSRVADIPPPPTLPGFLSKSILNGTTPMKDDSSVLNMPNHTVLNHLATSSIRQGVLATSLTTRYKRKYVTLITYRPTTLDE